MNVNDKEIGIVNATAGLVATAESMSRGFK